MKYFLPLLIVATLSCTPANAQENQGTGLAVLELFTSQSCADAPPADKIFEIINQTEQDNLITLSCHTRYLNSDDWQDTLTLAACDERQNAYLTARTINGFKIPQMIINGRAVISGTYEDKIYMIADRMRRMQPLQKIALSIEGNTLRAELPKAEDLKNSADLWLFTYKKQETIAITGGQNKDMSVTYTNIVTDIIHLDTWDGIAKALSIPLLDRPAHGYVVIAETQGDMNMIAAGKVLKPNVQTPEDGAPKSQAPP